MSHIHGPTPRSCPVRRRDRHSPGVPRLMTEPRPAVRQAAEAVQERWRVPGPVRARREPPSQGLFYDTRRQGPQRIRLSLCGLPAFDNLLVGSSLQNEREDTTPIRIVLYPDLPVMRPNNRVANGKADPYALTRDLLSVLYLVKFVKDSVLVGIRNARS